MGSNGTSTGAEARKRREVAGILRWTASLVLVVLGAALSSVSVPAQHAHSLLLDTDRYVATVEPLATDPVVQTEVIDQITDQILATVDVERIARDALGELTRNTPRAAPAITGLAPVIAERTRSMTRSAVSRVVASPQFNDLWIRANRAAHERLLSLVRGGTGGVLSMDEQGTVTLSARAITGRVKDALAGDGVEIASRIPDVDVTITLFESPELARLGRALDGLDRSYPLVAWLAAACYAVALAAAPGGARLRATAAIGMALAVAMTLLSVALSVGRRLYLGAVPPETISPAAAEVLIDAVAGPLPAKVRAVFVVGLLIALVAWLCGRPGSTDRAPRRISRLAARLAGRSREGTLRPWRHAIARNRPALAACIVGVGLLILVFWPDPTLAAVLWTVGLAAAALAALLLLCRAAAVGTP
jgi:hypothetical protein